MGSHSYFFEVSEFLEKYKEKIDKRSPYYDPYVKEIEALAANVYKIK